MRNCAPKPREADSLLPILESFQGLAILNGFYANDVTPEELARASSIAKSIVQFTLTDYPTKDDHPIMAGTVIRLVQLLSSVMQGPLFPNLAHLRIDHSESSADQLNIFLTPSMKTLELNNIGSIRQEEFSVFLKILAGVARDIERLTLRGLTQEGPILACLKFKQLLHLQIDGSAPISYSFLEGVGRLPALKTFHLRTPKTTTYTSQSNSTSDTSHAPGTNLYVQLSALHIDSSHELAQDLLGMVPSGALREISLTIWPKGQVPQSPKAKKVRPNPMSAFCHMTIKSYPIKSSPKTESPLNLKSLFIDDARSETIEQALQKWRETLQSVRVDEPETFPRVLSPTSVSVMVGLLNLQQLKISGWGIQPLSSFNFLDALLTTKRSSLQILHLPDRQSAVVTLPRLRTIAEQLPSLVELRCQLDVRSLGPASQHQPHIPGNGALSHQLKTLKLWTTGPMQPAQLLLLARCINYLFPDLEELDDMSKSSDNLDHLEGPQLIALVKLCQAVRKDEASRKPAPSAGQGLDGNSQVNIVT
ncbi:hypothetical protein D9613_010802 [Agrocybe pediades]|uniref:Uncharacterized protein n=1 Tax=Agrocybe pediades TaxID=84607 RepID=A0A8H4VKV5_9AGAR|nr:hypothetical protein D9613_010802 [Agrocybe pediades]